jgi:peptidoglycan/LPS O-acetylase OafA/YrhL
VLENRISANVHGTAYRPDLDGLRAVAVLSVIAYHLAHKALPGGYLGVDIFFVLSGYLITAIIWREQLAGRFSLATFYSRRVRRIMPALLLVLLVTAGVSALVLLPLDLVGMARSLLPALGFVANFYFWRDTDYFSRQADEKPLLHIWSLGVEEQFYLLFPLLLMLLARRADRAVAIIGAVAMISLAGNVMALQGGAGLPAFYLLPTRAWDLGTGALLAVVPVAIRSPRWAAAAGGGGAALVALSLATGRNLFPPSLPDALAVVAGTALLIAAGTQPANPASRALSLRGPVFVGLISYSLYLWHWPLLVILKYCLVRGLNGVEVVAALLVMALCATLSWRYVERPFRSRETPMRFVYLAVGAATLVTAGISMLLLAGQGFPARLDPAAARINAAVGSNYRCPLADYMYFQESRACELNLQSRDPAEADVVLFGNSHAQMYAPLVRDLIVARSLHGLLVPMNGCTPTLGFNVSSACEALASRNLEAIAALPRASVVVIATTWPRTDSGQQAGAHAFIAGLDRAIDRLRATGKRVVLVGPIVLPGWDVPSELSRSLAFNRPRSRPLFSPRADFEKFFGTTIAHFEDRTDVVFIRPDRIQCPGERCEFLMDGHSLFADSNHLSTAELHRFAVMFETALAPARAS